MKERFDYICLGFCSNDHLAVLPFIPMDTKVRMISHAILGGGPAGNSTAGAAALGLRAAFAGTVGDDADGRMILDDFAKQGVDTSMVKIRKGATSAIAYLWIEEKTGNRSCAWRKSSETICHRLRRTWEIALLMAILLIHACSDPFPKYLNV